LIAAALAAAPAFAGETLTASFLMPDGGMTTQSYSGIVHVTVSGIGQSLGQQYNDAFYLISSATHDANYYQLTFGTSPLVPFDPAQNAVNFVVGGLPAYQPSHVYSFDLDTGLLVPGQLHFGVGDGNFSDNSGSYRITVSDAPEPASWAMMVGGFGLIGSALRSRRKALVSFA
jgi:hypothetical protein